MQEPPNCRAKPNAGCHEHAEQSLQLAAVAAVHRQHDLIVQVNDTIEWCKWYKGVVHINSSDQVPVHQQNGDDCAGHVDSSNDHGVEQGSISASTSGLEQLCSRAPTTGRRARQGRETQRGFKLEANTNLYHKQTISRPQ